MKFLRPILEGVFLSTLALLLCGFISLNEQTVKRSEILQAINDGATYAADVLLDENGMSRCDYNILEGKWYPYEPAWHTGQIIYGLIRAYEVTKNEKYLQAAKRAGDWWTSLEIKDHPELKGMIYAAHGDYVEEYLIYSTVTDGSAGLFRLYDVTGIKRYADVPTAAGYWLLEHTWIPEYGMFYNVIDPKTGEVLTDRSPFFPDLEQPELNVVARPNNEGSIHKDMYEYTKDEKNKEIFIQVCESLVEKQGPEGLWMDFMPNSKAEGYFHPRFNLWYAESLIDGFELTGDQGYLQAAKKTAEMYAKVQKKDGTIYYRNYLDGHANKNSICGSAVSFAGIVWLRLLEHGVGEGFRDNIEKSVNWVLQNRYSTEHPDKNLAGGFFEIRTRRKDGKYWITIRDIATSFGLRFLSDYYQVHFASSDRN